MEQAAPLAAIRELLEYNWADEERDYAEHQVNGDHDGCEEYHPGRCGHIFERMQEISAWLDGQPEGPPRVGDTVKITSTGPGTVTEVDQDGDITVEFPWGFWHLRGDGDTEQAVIIGRQD